MDFEEYYSNPKYIESITKRFGAKITEHTKEMLKRKIHRKFARKQTLEV